ncbi:MAG: hypothetical protein EPO10_22380 [Reyranella sp.]|uniref:hypothetical protein n=1 Tax=Reyranella sp. TaxID=1929291 RepID=UPI0012137D45|nr:hypothetical protein [Reyranella sp.]TAJ97713.1 MAG: hypothetical protein EPO41_02415 [Reyranella sp.]TBR26604.1 MAG: hypothetical protein EPO10_22380 [Reyranella sp.]
METNTKFIVSGVAAAVLSIAAIAYAQTAGFTDSAGPQAVQQSASMPRSSVMPGEVTCASQHQEQPGLSTSDLLADSYEIKAAVPGGVWLQKKKDVFYCNSGVTRDDETMCWKIRAPLKGQNCTDAQNRARSKALPS